MTNMTLSVMKVQVLTTSKAAEATALQCQYSSGLVYKSNAKLGLLSATAMRN